MRKALWIVGGALLLATGLAGLAGCRQSQTATAPPSPGTAVERQRVELKMYVPCGMIIPVRAVMDAFEASHPNIKVTGVFDNSSIIVKRLTKKGEQADLVMSPGRTEMDRLRNAHMLTDEGPRAVGDFELVVIVPKNSTLDLKTPADLKKCKTLASPDPDLNSTGASGKEALTNLGLWDDVKSKMVFTEHAIQAYTMVASGKADAALAYRNCPLETAPEKLSKSKVRIAFSVPEDAYVRQQCLIAKTTGGHETQADEFMRFISSQEGLKILADNGMTGCLQFAQEAPAATDQPPGSGEKAPGKAVVKVVAYYPGNSSHAGLKNMVEGLPKEYDGKVSGEFVDFTSDAGFKKWQAAGLSCGGILINDKQTWTYDKDGKPVEVTFKMAEGGEWTVADLHAVLDKLVAEKTKGQ